MKYNVTINEKSKTITVELEGYKGVAKCCDTDQFNITTGIELALERAKVAKRDAEMKKSAVTKSGDVMELVRALEKALPKGQIILVGNGDGLTKEQKKWLHGLTDCKRCKCGGYTESDIEEAYNEGHDDGYVEGMADANPNDRYDEGYAEGHDDGYEGGYDKGHINGYEEGLSDGHDEGYDEGYDKGHIDGYEEGLSDGYDDGYSDAREEYEVEVDAEDLADRIREVIADLL